MAKAVVNLKKKKCIWENGKKKVAYYFGIISSFSGDDSGGRRPNKWPEG